MNPILNSTLMYAHLNFKVFILKVNSKNGQVLKSWLNEATTDEKIIQNWFSNTGYNVGVRTGDGLVVIDFYPDLLSIIHYVIEKGKYIGAFEKLAVGAGVTNCNGKHIRTLLDNYKQLLEQCFIHYKGPPRSSFYRKVEFIFYGEDALEKDVNDKK